MTQIGSINRLSTFVTDLVIFNSPESVEMIQFPFPTHETIKEVCKDLLVNKEVDIARVGVCQLCGRYAQISLLRDGNDIIIFFQHQPIRLGLVTADAYLAFKLVTPVEMWKDPDSRKDCLAIIPTSCGISDFFILSIGRDELEQELTRLMCFLLSITWIRYALTQSYDPCGKQRVERKSRLCIPRKKVKEEPPSELSSLVSYFVGQMAAIGWKAEVSLTKIQPEDSNANNQTRTKPTGPRRRVRQKSS